MKKNSQSQKKISVDLIQFDSVLKSRRLDLNRLIKERFQDKSLEQE